MYSALPIGEPPNLPKGAWQCRVFYQPKGRSLNSKVSAIGLTPYRYLIRLFRAIGEPFTTG